VQITPEQDYSGRFERALEGQGIESDGRVLLAVSGGPDSLALLLLARHWAADRIVAATVDHQLRPESADEADFVATLCADIGVRHIILVPSEKIAGNIQSAARAARYRLLDDAANQHECTFVATAHHGDDQIETILMRLARGSGIDGLAAIRSRNGRIIRPLLGFSKSELEEICNNAGISPLRDPSNDNADFDRVAIRQWLAKSPHPFGIDQVSRTAKAFDDASAALGWVTDDLATTRICTDSVNIQCDANGLPHELKRRLFLKCLHLLEPDLRARGDAVERAIAELEAGKSTMIGNVHCKGGQVWHFSPAPPRRTDGCIG
jgi:tRNA(Ile)-lysidine synthase